MKVCRASTTLVICIKKKLRNLRKKSLGCKIKVCSLLGHLQSSNIYAISSIETRSSAFIPASWRSKLVEFKNKKKTTTNQRSLHFQFYKMLYFPGVDGTHSYDSFDQIANSDRAVVTHGSDPMIASLGRRMYSSGEFIIESIHLIVC